MTIFLFLFLFQQKPTFKKVNKKLECNAYREYPGRSCMNQVHDEMLEHLSDTMMSESCSKMRMIHGRSDR